MDEKIKEIINHDINVFSFQDPATPVAEGIIDLHNYIIFYLIIILTFVLAVLVDIFIQNIELFKVRSSRFKFFTKYITFKPANFWVFRKTMLRLNNVNHATNLEIAWTILPSFILVFIAIPSLSLLYSMDEILYPDFTLHVIGSQWHWNYQISGLLRYTREDLFHKNRYLFDRMNPFLNTLFTDGDMSQLAFHRLLGTEESLFLPINRHIRVLVTSSDVLHSWAVPSFGIKIDAIPGRLNQGAVFIKRSGVFYGQCSELCGINHGFMPIQIVTMEEGNLNQVYESKITDAYKDLIQGSWWYQDLGGRHMGWWWGESISILDYKYSLTNVSKDPVLAYDIACMHEASLKDKIEFRRWLKMTTYPTEPRDWSFKNWFHHFDCWITNYASTPCYEEMFTYKQRLARQNIRQQYPYGAPSRYDDFWRDVQKILADVNETFSDVPDKKPRSPEYDPFLKKWREASISPRSRRGIKK